MESPSYSGDLGPVKKKSNIGCIIGGIVAGLCLCCGIGAFALFQVGKNAMSGAGNMLGCGNTLSDYRDAMIKYAKKHNGKLPPAATWQDDVKPFLVRSHLPPLLQGDKGVTDPDEYCDSTGSSVSFNTDYAGKSLSSMDPSAEQIILFEVSGFGKNKSGKFEPAAFETSPKIFNAPRGWIEQPLYGSAFIINQRGQKAPLTKLNQTSSTGSTATFSAN